MDKIKEFMTIAEDKIGITGKAVILRITPVIWN
jgi:hypothetical protein